MNRPRIVHLLNDLALGGVTRNLELFQKPEFSRAYYSALQQVDPSWSAAPALDADVIFVHFPPSWDNLRFLWSLRKKHPDSHLVWMEHSYHRDWETIQVRSKSRFRAMLRIAASLFDDIICVSAAQERWLRAILGAREGFFHVIHPWSDLSGLDQLAMPKFNSAQAITIGAYGRFAESKGFAELIRAVKLIGPASNTYLNIGGYGEQEADLRQLARRCANIRICGKVESLPHFLSRCDVVAVPSRFESFGLVAAEAKMAGRPIIVSTAGGLPEQVGNGGVIADCQSPQTLAKCLQGLRFLPLKQMASAARSEAKKMEVQRIASWLTYLRRVSARPVSRSIQSPALWVRRLAPIKMSAGQ